MEKERMSRRNWLSLSGSIGTAVVSGCLRLSRDTESETSNPTQSNAQTTETAVDDSTNEGTATTDDDQNSETEDETTTDDDQNDETAAITFENGTLGEFTGDVGSYSLTNGWAYRGEDSLFIDHLTTRRSGYSRNSTHCSPRVAKRSDTSSD